MKNIPPLLIVPSDEPLQHAYLKKLCIFFPKIILPHPDDKALIHEKDVTESFPGIESWWAERNTYPRTENYVEQLNFIIDHCEELKKRGIVNIIDRSFVKNVMDPGAHHVAFMGITADKKAVLSAIPDIDKSKKPNVESYLWGGEISFNGNRSKYQVDNINPAFIDGYPQEWSCLAHMRLGRFVKYNNIAAACGYNPYYYGKINSSIARSFNGESSLSTTGVSASLLEYLMISIFDDTKFSESLEDVPWSDVLHLRKKLLPHVSGLIRFLEEKQTKLLRLNKKDDAIYEYIEEINKDYNKLKGDYAEAIDKLKMGSLIKLSGTIVCGGGISALLTAGATSNYIASLVALLGAGFLAMYKEFLDVISKKRRLNRHALSIVDMYENSIQQLTNNTSQHS